MDKYDHLKIERKWQKYWEKNKTFQVKLNPKKKKFYSLIEFPYPSGEGLHVGHVRSNTAMDIISRKRRMEGFNVLYPIGWDAFGLPTENYAIKTSTPPEVVTKRNTDNFRRQLKSIGFSFDWDREINTTDPKYYKWTQWVFLQLYKKGLAYKKKMVINWCPKDKIGLANEEVINGCCERCSTPVEKREKEQWMLAITKYAKRLDEDLDDVDYLEKIKIQQRNWIGKSEGAEIDFEIKDSIEKIKVFTTRPDTIFGATYVVVSPEHEFVEKLKDKLENFEEVSKYIREAKNKDDIERTSEGKEKTGVEIKGIKVINPANGEEIPVWVADYVLVHYGTGAVMAVPAHDQRDFDFAGKYGLSVKEVIHSDVVVTDSAYIGQGKLVNSGKFDGINSEEVKKDITKFVGGKWVTKFKLRDWVFSRQRYWGEPIPLVHCDKCGTVPIPEKDLPVKLPKVDKYEPTDTGESPLANIDKWVNVKCPKCGGKAKRETDTMPQWAGSSWYYLRFADTTNSKKFADLKALKYFTPVDWYNGGMEHTTLHLLYSRFWHKFLYDLRLVPTKEPYKKRTSHGMILAEGGEKMSKSKGNVVNPDAIVRTYGADTLRIYEMFMGPFDQNVSWTEENIIGVRRFIERVWKIGLTYNFKVKTPKDLEGLLQETIEKISNDIESMSFNTSISCMMIFINALEKHKTISRKDFEIFLKIVSPFVPHLAEELWNKLGNNKSISTEKWPKVDRAKIEKGTVHIVVQVNGKVRTTFETEKGIDSAKLEDLVKSITEVSKWFDGKKIIKTIHIKDKLINFVVS